MGISSTISTRGEDYFFDPFQIGGGGSGGGAGGATTAGGIGLGIAAAAAAVTSSMEKNGTKELVDNIFSQQSKESTAPTAAAKPNEGAKALEATLGNVTALDNTKATPTVATGKPSVITQVDSATKEAVPPETKATPTVATGKPNIITQVDSATVEAVPASTANTATAEQSPNNTSNNSIKDAIVDTTEDNLEQAIGTTGVNANDWMSFALEQQQRQWDREDAIRKETQEREDSAYQRAVADMKKAGINPNLMGVNPANSGGGITTATGVDYTTWATDFNAKAALLEQEIENAFKGDQAEKERISGLISDIIGMFSFK